MQKDFHYYMTYMAARAAGYGRQLSHIIGEYNEIVDETFNSDDFNPVKHAQNQWVKEKWHPNQIAQGYCHRTAYSTMAQLHFIKTEGRKPDKAMPWIAFHFLPGLGTDGKYRFDYDAHEKVLESGSKTGKIGTRKTGLTRQKLVDRLKRFQNLREKGGLLKWDYKNQLMCWPDSPCSNAMMNDTLRIAEAYKQGGKSLSGLDALKQFRVKSDSPADKNRFENLITDFDAAIKKLGNMGGINFDKFLAALVGIRMHTFNDTWAHQGFAGLRSAGINDVIGLKCAYQKNGKYEDLNWKTRIWVSEKTQNTYFGHGRADSFPDHPGIRISYTRPWDEKRIERDNPAEFERAYGEAVKWFKKIGAKTGWNKQRSGPPGFLPAKINGEFFKKLRKTGGKKGYDEKKHRSDLLNGYIDKHDKIKLTPFSNVDADFGIIRQMYNRSKVDLAYFNIAAIYHQLWFENQVMKHLDKLKAKNAYEVIRKIIGPASKFASEVIS